MTDLWSCSVEMIIRLCLSCAEEDHKTHNTVKAQKEMMRKLVQKIQDTIKKNKEIKCSRMIMSKKNKEKEEADIELCTDLNYSTERCQMTLPEHWAKTRMKFVLLLSSSWIYRVYPLQKG